MSSVTMLGSDSPMIPPLPGTLADPPPQAPHFGQGGMKPPNGVPVFFIEAVKHADGTYVNTEFVDIMTPGDPKSMPRHKVTERIKEMYRPWYEQFRRGLAMAPDGVPLEMWPMTTPAVVQTLKALNIFTVEQLVAVADGNLHHIPMGRTLQNQARAWLADKSNADSVEKHRRETEMLREGMRMLEDRNNALAAQIATLAAVQAAKPTVEAAVPDAVPAPEKRGPGRPPKAA